jgi:hypothetical protein
MASTLDPPYQYSTHSIAAVGIRDRNPQSPGYGFRFWQSGRGFPALAQTIAGIKSYTPIAGVVQFKGQPGRPFGFWRSVISEIIPLRAVHKGTQFHEGSDVPRLPTSARLLQAPIQQLLDRPLYHAPANRLTPTQAQGIV